MFLIKAAATKERQDLTFLASVWKKLKTETQANAIVHLKLTKDLGQNPCVANAKKKKEERLFVSVTKKI